MNNYYHRGWVKPPKVGTRRWFAFMNFVISKLKYVLPQVKLLQYNSQYYYTKKVINGLTQENNVKLWLENANKWGMTTTIKELQVFLKPFIKISKENLKLNLKAYASEVREKQRVKRRLEYDISQDGRKKLYGKGNNIVQTQSNWLPLSTNKGYVYLLTNRTWVRRAYRTELEKIIFRYLASHTNINILCNLIGTRFALCKDSNNKLVIGWTRDYWQDPHKMEFKRLPNHNEIEELNELVNRNYKQFKTLIQELETVKLVIPQ